MKLEANKYTVEDVEVGSENCPHHAKPGDHLLVEFEFSLENGTNFGPYATMPGQLFHILLERSVSISYQLCVFIFIEYSLYILTIL